MIPLLLPPCLAFFISSHLFYLHSSSPLLFLHLCLSSFVSCHSHLLPSVAIVLFYPPSHLLLNNPPLHPIFLPLFIVLHTSSLLPFTLPIPLLLPHYLLLLSSPSLHFLSLIKPYYTSLYRTSPHVILPNFTSHHVSHQIQYSHMPDPYTYLNLFIGLPFNYRKSVLAEVSLLKDHKLEYLLCKNPAVEVIMDEYLML